MRLPFAILLVSALPAFAQTASYPGAIATPSQLKTAVNGVITVLTANANPVQTSFVISACARLAANVLITIDSEIMPVTGCAGTTLVVGSRGFDGTTPATHIAGANINANVDAWHHNALSAEVQAIESTLGTNLSNIVNVPGNAGTATTLKGTLSDQSVTTGAQLLALCVAAKAQGKTLLMSQMWDVNGACAASVYAYGNGGYCPTVGHTITQSGPFDGDHTQHICTSPAGTVDFTGTVPAFLPEWTGATCASGDNTVALQQIFNTAPAGATLKLSCLYKMQAGSLYVPSTMHNAIIEGAPGTWAFVDRGLTNTVGLQAITGHSGTMLNVLAPGIHIQDLWFNCAGFASHGLVVQNTTLGILSNVGTGSCTSDGAQSNPYAGPTTTLTSNIAMGAGPSTTFTVQSSVLPGQTLGAPDCTEVMVHYGNSDQDEFVVSRSGNTLTITSGTSTNAHASGQSIQCVGSNGSLLVYGYQAYRNAGWGWNMFQATNENSFVFQDPTMFVNGLGGLLATGSSSIHRGGHYESNGGPSVQLGDLNGDSFFGPGRPTAGWSIGHFGDDEGNSANGVTSICDFHSTVQLADITQLHTNSPGGPFCPFDPAGVSTIAFGRTSETGTGTPQFASASGLGDFIQTPGTDHAFQAHNLAGDLLAQKTYASSSSTTGIITTHGPVNRAVECTGTDAPVTGCAGVSANHALIVYIVDAITGAPFAFDITTNGTPIEITLTHTLGADPIDNTISFVGAGHVIGSAYNIRSHYNPGNLLTTAYVAGGTPILEFSNPTGRMLDRAQ